MNAVSALRPQLAPTLADLANAVLAADTAWDAAHFTGGPGFAVADAALIDARKDFVGALIAETGISREMFDRLGVVL